MVVKPLGDSAFLLTLGERIDHGLCEQARRVADAIEAAALPWVREVVPAYASVMVVVDPLMMLTAPVARSAVRTLEQLGGPSIATRKTPAGRQLEIPVCYGGDFGPDLGDVARHTGLHLDEVIHRHASANYVVGCIGFMPGFPYLLGLPATLSIPRRATPRTEVPAGSVAIAGDQAGIYPLRSPGGWHVIGRTPLRLFDPAATPPAMLRPGDRVRFVRIAAEEFSRQDR